MNNLNDELLTGIGVMMILICGNTDNKELIIDLHKTINLIFYYNDRRSMIEEDTVKICNELKAIMQSQERSEDCSLLTNILDFHEGTLSLKEDNLKINQNDKLIIGALILHRLVLDKYPELGEKLRLYTDIVYLYKKDTLFKYSDIHLDFVEKSYNQLKTFLNVFEIMKNYMWEKEKTSLEKMMSE